MPTRRHVLAEIDPLAAIEGCLSPTQESGGAGGVCGSGIGQHPGDVFSLTLQVQTFGSNDQPLVKLVFPLRQATIESQNRTRLVVYSGDDLLYRIPSTPDDEAAVPTAPS